MLEPFNVTPFHVKIPLSSCNDASTMPSVSTHFVALSHALLQLYHVVAGSNCRVMMPSHCGIILHIQHLFIASFITLAQDNLYSFVIASSQETSTTLQIRNYLFDYHILRSNTPRIMHLNTLQHFRVSLCSSMVAVIMTAIASLQAT